MNVKESQQKAVVRSVQNIPRALKAVLTALEGYVVSLGGYTWRHASREKQ